MNPRIKAMSGVMLQALSAAQQDVLVDLWQVDLRPLGGRIFYFCNQVNERGTAVVWQGQAYEPYPIKADGFESTSQGAGNRPTLTVSNLLGLITGAADQFGQLVGVQVVRRQTYAKFLDAVNFQSGRNPTADPMQEVVGKYLVERMTALNAETATFELAAPSESDGSYYAGKYLLLAVSRRRMRLYGACGCRPFRYAHGRCVQRRMQQNTDRM